MSELAPPPPNQADDGLGRRVTTSVRWVTVSTAVTMTTTWVTTVALARMLEREEFGLAAMAMLVVAVLALFQDSGLHAALIQRQERVREAVDTAVLYAPLTGLVLAAVCMGLAPLAALFFHEDGVESLARALGAVFVLRSFSVVPNALLQKELLFGRRSVVTMSGAVLQMGAAIALAALGAGAWAVIGGHLVVAGWSAALLWVVCPVRPDPRRASLAELRELLRYGRHIVAGNVVGFVNSFTDGIVIGRLFGTAALGTYTLGFQTGRQAVTTVTHVSNQVVFPAYAKLQGDVERFRRAYLRSLRFICVISMPAAFGLAAVSEEFVRVVYGGKWEEAIPVLAIIAFQGLFLSVSATTGEVFKAAGKPQYFFQMGLLQLVLLGGLIGALYPFGISGFAGARAGAAFAMGGVALALASRILGIERGEWVRTLRPSLSAAVVMGGGVVLTKLAIGLATPTSSVPMLVLLVAEGAALYAVAMRLLASRQWAEFLAEVKRLSAFSALRRRLQAALRPRATLPAGPGKEGT